jgi:hypothetical protein
VSRDQEAPRRLGGDLHPSNGKSSAPTAAELAAVADHLETVIAEADPQKATARLQLLIEELRVNSRAELKVNGRAEIQPTYRVISPTVCATSEKVEAAGIEPAQCSPRFVLPWGCAST